MKNPKNHHGIARMWEQIREVLTFGTEYMVGGSEVQKQISFENIHNKILNILFCSVKQIPGFNYNPDCRRMYFLIETTS